MNSENFSGFDEAIELSLNVPKLRKISSLPPSVLIREWEDNAKLFTKEQ